MPSRILSLTIKAGAILLPNEKTDSGHHAKSPFKPYEGVTVNFTNALCDLKRTILLYAGLMIVSVYHLYLELNT